MEQGAALVVAFGLLLAAGCGTSEPVATGSTTSTTFESVTTTSLAVTGNLTFTVSVSPERPKAGDLVTFSFVKDDPDASAEYVCGNTSYGTDEYIVHLPCPPPGEMCEGFVAPEPVHGHREWISTYTYAEPGTYDATFTTKSGDANGCDPNGDEGILIVTLEIT